MHVLLANDDGVYAPGINRLYEVLTSVCDVTVVAPDRNRSGAAHSLTLQAPVTVHQLPNGMYCVAGTPVDGVHLALTGFIDKPIDMVISGINAGSNLGDDVWYSGTVAAAMEGRFLAHPGMALSLVGDAATHFDTAAQVALDLFKHMDDMPLSAEVVLNVNVPDRPYADLAGYAVTRLGSRHCADPTMATHDPRGRPIYWIGPSGVVKDGAPGTDFAAVEAGFVSITPLLLDITAHQACDVLTGWLPESLEV